ncbi:MAG TPA: hypothetical protein VKZ98_06300, partial [Aquaticitalea sp.]|nr:hypothetical protein [Aquaticitalea sp.]
MIMFMSLAEGAFARITVPDKIEKGKISLTRANTDLDTSIAEWKIVCTSLVTNEIVPRQRIEMEIESNASLDSCSVEVWIRDELLSTNNIGTIKKGKSAIELLLPERSDTVLTRWV